MTKLLCVDRGVGLPMGATRLAGGVNFSIYSRHATDVTLSLFRPGEEEEPFEEFALDAAHHRTGHAWHLWLGGLEEDFEYAWRMDMRPNPAPHIYRYDPSRYLLDPFARVVTGGQMWGGRVTKRRCALEPAGFQWGDDRPLNRPLENSIIYELHVRSYTRHPSSEVSAPGTYLGLTEKIPYLSQLGVTAVELLPVYEFEEADTDRNNPLLGTSLLNLWGYQPIAFFAPNSAYASSQKVGAAVSEFKEMVRRFHAAGIEVILDVVFNHTAEGDERGPTWSFRGIDNPTYYLLDEQGKYRNYSGCGNTFNCNHPVSRAMIISCLRYWVMEMHVDGFRFDLASILARGKDGQPLADPPLLESLAYDPVLADTKLIAEAWDAAGLYQVGSFPSWGRWAEWNGRYRDDLRRFVKSDEGLTGALASRLAGSPDLYADDNRHAKHSINFITCHDGFTLNDLVSYNRKHNEPNGEENRDGANDNHSWNCGVEGATDEAAVRRLRQRQVRNFITLLFASGGVPMILGGDEFGRTQQGNNNAYCQDNEISWVDWSLETANAHLLRFVREVIRLRREARSFRHVGWHEDGNTTRVQFHGVRPGNPDWRPEARALAVEYVNNGERFYLAANAWWEALEFTLPAGAWQRVIDTSLDSPDDIAMSGEEPPVEPEGVYRVAGRSVVLLRAAV